MGLQEAYLFSYHLLGHAEGSKSQIYKICHFNSYGIFYNRLGTLTQPDMCVCVCVRVYACVRVCVRACVRVCVRRTRSFVIVLHRICSQTG